VLVLVLVLNARAASAGPQKSRSEERLFLG
jgi:hypothetical protein